MGYFTLKLILNLIDLLARSIFHFVRQFVLFLTSQLRPPIIIIGVFWVYQNIQLLPFLILAVGAIKKILRY